MNEPRKHGYTQSRKDRKGLAMDIEIDVFYDKLRGAGSFPLIRNFNGGR